MKMTAFFGFTSRVIYQLTVSFCAILPAKQMARLASDDEKSLTRQG
jgi:hypothetical protein